MYILNSSLFPLFPLAIRASNLSPVSTCVNVSFNSGPVHPGLGILRFITMLAVPTLYTVMFRFDVTYHSAKLLLFATARMETIGFDLTGPICCYAESFCQISYVSFDVIMDVLLLIESTSKGLITDHNGAVLLSTLVKASSS